MRRHRKNAQDCVEKDITQDIKSEAEKKGISRRKISLLVENILTIFICLPTLENSLEYK
jgi:hypothetical protein